MFCKKCGKESDSNQKFCTSCGTQFLSASNVHVQSKEASFDGSKIVSALVIIAFIGWGIYASLDDDAVETNNDAVSAFSSGDSDSAITQLQQAANNATFDTNKLNTLKNLGYVYATEGYYDKALVSFKDALQYTSENSFEYYLVSGEIALLEGKPTSAKISYGKAYDIKPNDFQINNALNLFYMDLEDLYPEHVDYIKALEHAQKAYKVIDSDLKKIARQNLAIAHFFNENYSQTISLLSTFDMNKEPYLAYWLGLSYAMEEDETNAVFYLQKAVDAGVEVEQEVYDYLYSY
ncbi:hypothetical protein ACFL6I_28630 [candidate division KSB1 bacterium]